MKADLTLNSFDPFKHFSGVLMQQGRVQLDADWNAEGAILLHYLRRLAADIIGSQGTSDDGFQILTAPSSAAGDVLINAGSYYVDGILCELESTPTQIVVTDAGNNKIVVDLWTVDEVAFQTGQYVRVTVGSTFVDAQVVGADYASRTLTLDSLPSGAANTNPGTLARWTTYLSQPDLPDATQLTSPSLMYLDVWERLITCFEDDSIREVALNGPDTAARTQVVWQVKALPGQSACMAQQDLTTKFQPWDRGYLRARVRPNTASTDPCIVSPNSSYYGPENQLYRVEINRGSGDSSGPPTFKWSRENGAVVFPILQLTPGSGQTTVALANLGRDDRFGLVEGDYVEIEDDASVLNNVRGQLLQVQSIDSSNLIVVLAGTAGNVGKNQQRHPLLRRWDQKLGDPAEGGLQLSDDNAVPIPTFGTSFDASESWLALEDGIEIAFVGDASTMFRTSDYWLIPARVATGNIIWPTETTQDSQGNTIIDPIAKPPDGVTHHYAPLAVYTSPTDGQPAPCRWTFSKLAVNTG